MKHVVVICAAAALGGCATPQSGNYLASNDLVVEPSEGPRFSIPYRGLSGASDFWCAAGEYVIEGLGRPVGTAIWRVSEPPRRSGEGIEFSLSSEGAASRTGVVELFGGGDASLSAERARELCDVLIERE